KEREGAYQGLRQQVLSMMETQKELRSETANLVRALRTPAARGRWGEIQLRRVVELAGMLDHCDFKEQASVTTEQGRLRPDMVVRLPGGKTLVVDAKAPVEAYLDAVAATDDEARRAAVARHARHVREHLKQLGAKTYWDQFQDSPEFVVLFLPGENFFSAALEHDPGLIEAGIDNGVVLATPTTLIALLRAVAYGWRQEKLARNAREISALGADLYKRLSDLGGHMDRLGGRLADAVGCYNRAVGTLESRVLVSARRFRDLHAVPAGAELGELNPVDQSPREIQAPELRGLPQPAE
ncbi:MAG TPA: DNA recombination protein RmuC, partial [Arenibaculum sp.]|nr:DNA recombination protein RmuC [Arenibaculum sp.]